MKKIIRTFMMVFMVIFLTEAAFAESTVQELQAQLEKVIRQMEEMEATMKSQKAQIEAFQNQIRELQAKGVPPAAPAEVKTTSKYKVDFYGQVKMDAAYDTSNLGKDEYITYVPKDADGEDRTTFNIRDTRFGIAIDGPSLGGWKTRGRFETDFYGDIDNSNGGLRIRLSYIDFIKGDTLIRIGQDWNKIASMNPTNIDFAIMGYNGNLWNRVPQLTVEQKLGSGIEGLLTIYRYRWKDDKEGNLHAQLHLPWIGTKIAYSGRLFDREKNTYLALGAAIRNGEVNNNNVTPYVVALEWKVPYNIFELRGEGYVGQGIGSEYFHKGGAFNSTGKEIQTKGCFVQLGISPLKNIQVTFGYGIDDPDNGDVGSEFYRQSKYTFGNVYYQLMKDITAAFQTVYLETDWINGSKYGARYQTSLIYQW